MLIQKFLMQSYYSMYKTINPSKFILLYFLQKKNILLKYFIKNFLLKRSRRRFQNKAFVFLLIKRSNGKFPQENA